MGDKALYNSTAYMTIPIIVLPVIVLTMISSYIMNNNMESLEHLILN